MHVDHTFKLVKWREFAVFILEASD